MVDAVHGSGRAARWSFRDGRGAEPSPRSHRPRAPPDGDTPRGRVPRPQGAGTHPVSPETLQAEVERVLSSMPALPPARAGLLSELKGVLETAFKLRRRGDSAIGAEHLLAGTAGP